MGKAVEITVTTTAIDKDLAKLLTSLLVDKERPGGPSTPDRAAASSGRARPQPEFVQVMKRVMAGIVAASMVILLAAPPASANWSTTGYFNLRVLGHKFTKVTVRSHGCRLRLTVHFQAPRSRYLRYRYYRFQVKVTLSNGAWIRTPVFGNSSYGPRSYT